MACFLQLSLKVILNLILYCHYTGSVDISTTLKLNHGPWYALWNCPQVDGNWNNYLSEDYSEISVFMCESETWKMRFLKRHVLGVWSDFLSRCSQSSFIWNDVLLYQLFYSFGKSLQLNNILCSIWAWNAPRIIDLPLFTI